MRGSDGPLLRSLVAKQWAGCRPPGQRKKWQITSLLDQATRPGY
jgi:hypothetical protein